MTNLSFRHSHGSQSAGQRKGEAAKSSKYSSQEDVTDALLRLVMYFDVFRHPLTEAELVRFIAPKRPDVVQPVIDQLCDQQQIERHEEFIHRVGMSETISRRKKRAHAAEKIWPNARRAAAVLYRLPQVRGVLVTGSLSKNSTNMGDDVDFMLLVEPGHVWTLKTVLQGLRKGLPEGIREYFCTNYLLDISCPEIDDQNMFTAIELATAVPMAGRTATTQLLEANQHWAQRYVPGFSWAIERAKRLRPDKAYNRTFSSHPWLEKQAMELWNRYWNRKYHWLEPEAHAQRFKRRPEVATNHLHDFQEYVLGEVERRLQPMGVSLPKVERTVP